MVEVESVVESNASLVLDEHLSETSNESAVTGQALHSGSADPSAVQLAMAEESPMDVGAVEEMETVLTEVGSHTPTPIYLFNCCVVPPKSLLLLRQPL